MIFNDLIEISSVYPGPLGGGVFRGTAIGEKSAKSFVCSYKAIITMPKPGEYWRIQGNIFHSEEYGVSVNVDSGFIRPMPSSKLIARLLCKHPAFKGFYLGRVKVERLVTEIGEFALVELLNNNDYRALSEVISEPIAKRTCQAWLTLKDQTEIATFLVDNEFDSHLASQVIRLCRYNTVDRLKKNPYSLIALTNTNISTLNMIDRVGKKLAIASDSPFRMAGIVEYSLYRCLENGNTMVELDNLCVSIKKLSLEDMPAPLGCIKAALKQKVACVYEENSVIYIQAIGVAFIERSLEDNLRKLANNPIQNDFLSNTKELEKTVTRYCSNHALTHGYELTSDQQTAISMALCNRLSILTGYGGTGKTSVIKGIVEVADLLNKNVYVAALAGKAKERARQAIGRDTFTIHGLINEIKKNKSKAVSKYSDPLIIIDECSMVDITLMNNLFRAMGENSFSLLMIGDTAQLPPVGFGVFWHELAKSDSLPSTHLTQVHRQAAESPIHKAAMHIRNSEKNQLGMWKGELEGVFLLDKEASDINSRIIDITQTHKATILTPFRTPRFSLSTVKLNALLQTEINKCEGEIYLGNHSIKEKDPILVTRNSYDLGLFNGMTGKVMSLGLDEDTQQPFCDIQFDGMDTIITLTKAQCYEAGIELAYALTVHKSQGSEYEVCMVIVTGDHMDKSMLYTALTRASKLCLIIGSQAAYDSAITNPARIEKLNHGFRWTAFTSDNSKCNKIQTTANL